MPNLCKPKMRRDVTHSRGEKQLLDLRQNQEPKSWAPGRTYAYQKLRRIRTFSCFWRKRLVGLSLSCIFFKSHRVTWFKYLRVAYFCFRALFFSLSRMAMVSYITWLVMQRVLSRLTTYRERYLVKRPTLKCSLSPTGCEDLRGSWNGFSSFVNRLIKRTNS